MKNELPLETISNGIHYTLHGDYYLPDIGIPNQHCALGKWGMLKKDYLEEYKPTLYTRLLLSGKLYEHLMAVDRQAQERLVFIIKQMQIEQGITEELKAVDQMAWVGLMNNIQSCAEEIIRSEMIYD